MDIPRITKIISTIGPATQKLETLREMAENGMNIIRLNMSHGDHHFHGKIISNIKALNKTLSYPVAILCDTQGPEIRTGVTEKDIFLKKGEIFTLTVGQANPEENSIDVNYHNMINDLSVGDKVTVDNGLINLEVLEKIEGKLRCKVMDGGTLGSRKHINLPGIRVNLPSITPKDEKDILFALMQDVDFIALSFVRSREDVLALRKMVKETNGFTRIIAKIEDREGVENIDEIIAEADGIMVARGDLGVEVPIEELPILQRQIVKKCTLAGKRVIIATHLLESMIENPMPTRAEVTDVANAVFEEADCVMLSGETTIGKYPVRAVNTLDKIARRVERSGGIRFVNQRPAEGLKEEIARSAVQLADSLKSRAIVVITRRGVMADHVTNFHPVYSPIYAFTNMSTARRRLWLNRGVYPFRINFSQDPEKTIRHSFDLLKKRNLIRIGDQVVLVSDVIAGESRVDAIQVRTIN